MLSAIRGTTLSRCSVPVCRFGPLRGAGEAQHVRTRYWAQMGDARGGTVEDSATVAYRREVSAGGVVYRERPDGGLEFVLASRRTRTGDLVWGLPKGRIDPGESIEEAAIREVREESGLVAEISQPLGAISYTYTWDRRGVSKVVHFFLMRALGGTFDDHDDEMEEVRWFPVDEVAAAAAYDSERDVIERAIEALS
jgi:8-oxo-dGTP pyrophosphatase MutT (NUDIX family)